MAQRAARAAALGLAVLLAACASSVEDRLTEVRALQDAGQFVESIEPLREILARNPDLADANYLLGVALVQTGQPSLAVWPLEKASADPAYAVQAGLLLSNTFLMLQAHGDSIRVATKVLESDPNRIAALKLRTEALLGAGRREEALADATRLRELEPDDYPALLMQATILAELGRQAEAEKAHEDLEALAAKSEDPGIPPRGCLARASFYEDTLKDEARAEQQWERCIEKWPTDPLALQLVSQFYDERQRPAEATAIQEQALAKEPENLGLRNALATRYQNAGDEAKARALLQEGIEILGSAAAWNALSEFERRGGRSEPALEALEQALKAAPSAPDQLLFAKADLLVDLGRLDEAQALIDGLADQSTKELLRGRILLERGDAKAALVAFESGLRRWPGNPGGRYLAGLAARALGDWDRAATELRESTRSDFKATDAALVLASIELARGRLDEATFLSRRFIDTRGAARPEAYALFIRAAVAKKDYDAAREMATRMWQAGFASDAAAARASIEAAASGPDDAVKSLRASGLDFADPRNESALRALADHLVALGRAEEARKEVARARAAHPDVASLQELEGTVLLYGQRSAEAKAAFEKALALDADNARAKVGLGQLAAAAGDRAQAIALYDEAARMDPDMVAPLYAAAQLSLAGGDLAGARERLEKLVQKDPGHSGAYNDLAYLLADAGENLERALQLAQIAYDLDPNPDITDTLGFVHLQRGENQRAAELFHQAVAAKPESQSLRYHLGLALARQGDRAGAEAALRQALDAGPFPEAEKARSELARLASQ